MIETPIRVTVAKAFAYLFAATYVALLIALPLLVTYSAIMGLTTTQPLLETMWRMAGLLLVWIVLVILGLYPMMDPMRYSTT